MAVPFLLAPMAELSHRPLRELIESFKPKGSLSSSSGNDTVKAGEGEPEHETGADEYFTEMISAGAFVNKGRFEKWYIDNGPAPHKLVYQVVSGDENLLVQAAAALDQKECRGIDINMGCSAPAITRTGAGVRWMVDIDRAASLVHRLRPVTNHRLSIKLRIGMENDFAYLVRFCRRLEDEGVELITLHPRTAKEKFKRKARWNYISALRNELHIPVVGNGDIGSPEEMLRRSLECDGVMMGRLAVRCPWVFTEAKSIRAFGKIAEKQCDVTDQPPCNADSAETTIHTTTATIDIRDTGLLFLDLLSRYQPPEFHVSRARRFFGYFCDNLKWGNYVKNLINREVDLLGIERAWTGYFAK